MTGAGTNTYLVGVGEVAVIDPGPDDGAHIAAIMRATDREHVHWVLLTHTHSDHAPGAPSLARETGAQILAFSGRQGMVTPDRVLGDGAVLTGGPHGGFTLEALHTPGHASNHLCFLLREERALFSGDLIMSGSTVVIAPPDGDMAAYMSSLRRLKQVPLARIYPGHGEVIETPEAVIDEYIQHRLDRERQVLDALGRGPRRIAEMVPGIYAGVPAVLHRMAALSVYAHLLKLRAEGKVIGTDQDSEWRLA
jgi:glyoxylase-like metal-dependent hydrolase (beta-lactamase superfamily II)